MRKRNVVFRPDISFLKAFVMMHGNGLNGTEYHNDNRQKKDLFRIGEPGRGLFFHSG
jgi:hypothetical protein